jgi:hypothetical protein
MARLTLTAKEAANPVNQPFLSILLELSSDGIVTKDELRYLHEFLLANPSELEAYHELKLRTSLLVARTPTPLECQEFQFLIERILPKAVRDDLVSRLGADRTTQYEIKELIALGCKDVPKTRQDAWNIRDRMTRSKRDSRPATEAQLEFLKNLGYRGTQELGVASASKLIDEYIEKRDNYRHSHNSNEPNEVTPRQRMLLDFWNIEFNTALTKSIVSDWLDKAYLADYKKKEAWELYKTAHNISDTQTYQPIVRGSGWQYLEKVGGVTLTETGSPYLEKLFFPCNLEKARQTRVGVPGNAIKDNLQPDKLYEEDSALTELGLDASYHTNLELAQLLQPEVQKSFIPLPKLVINSSATPPPMPKNPINTVPWHKQPGWILAGHVGLWMLLLPVMIFVAILKEGGKSGRRHRR